MGKEYQRLVSILGNLPIAGNIVFYDDFSGLLKWGKYIGTGDSILELDPSLAKQGNQSLFFKSRITAAAEDDYVGAYRDVHLLPSKVITFISSFQYPSKTAVKAIYFLIEWFDGTTLHSPSIRYTPATPSWEYQASDGGWVVIPDLAITLAIDVWHIVQFQVSFSADKYISLSVNSTKVDLSGISSQSGMNAADNTLRTTIYLATAGAAPSEMNLAEVLLHEI